MTEIVHSLNPPLPSNPLFTVVYYANLQIGEHEDFRKCNIGGAEGAGD
jgi:hypothetical protein